MKRLRLIWDRPLQRSYPFRVCAADGNANEHRRHRMQRDSRARSRMALQSHVKRAISGSRAEFRGATAVRLLPVAADVPARLPERENERSSRTSYPPLAFLLIPRSTRIRVSISRSCSSFPARAHCNPRRCKIRSVISGKHVRLEARNPIAVFCSLRDRGIASTSTLGAPAHRIESDGGKRS